MRLGNEAKEIFEYYQKYLTDRRWFSGNIRQLVEKGQYKLSHFGYQPYKWFFILPLLIVSTTVCGILAILTSLFISPRAGGYFAVRWARINSFFTPMTVTVGGAENIEPDVSYVIVANHQSLYDIYALYGWLGVDFKWVMKKELAQVPILGLSCKILGHIFIDRKDSKSAVETINLARKKIVNGTSVLFFPEGTRSSNGKLGDFKKGAFKMAIDMGISVLPVTINGTGAILPKGSLDLMPGNVSMIIHKPIPVNSYREENIGQLLDRTKITIAASLD